jgi:hypothetical protein
VLHSTLTNELARNNDDGNNRRMLTTWRFSHFCLAVALGGRLIRKEKAIETQPNRPGFFSVQSSVCPELPLRRFPRAVLRVLENGARAGSKGRGRDEGDGESNNRHELRP